VSQTTFGRHAALEEFATCGWDKAVEGDKIQYMLKNLKNAFSCEKSKPACVMPVVENGVTD
jgi:hypothetical protein